MITINFYNLSEDLRRYIDFKIETEIDKIDRYFNERLNKEDFSIYIKDHAGKTYVAIGDVFLDAVHMYLYRNCAGLSYIDSIDDFSRSKDIAEYVKVVRYDPDKISYDGI